MVTAYYLIHYFCLSLLLSQVLKSFWFSHIWYSFCVPSRCLTHFPLLLHTHALTCVYTPHTVTLHGHKSLIMLHRTQEKQIGGYSIVVSTPRCGFLPKTKTEVTHVRFMVTACLIILLLKQTSQLRFGVSYPFCELIITSMFIAIHPPYIHAPSTPS